MRNTHFRIEKFKGGRKMTGTDGESRKNRNTSQKFGYLFCTFLGKYHDLALFTWRWYFLSYFHIPLYLCLPES